MTRVREGTVWGTWIATTRLWTFLCERPPSYGWIYSILEVAGLGVSIVSQGQFNPSSIEYYRQSTMECNRPLYASWEA